jgi:hypothetical protein
MLTFRAPVENCGAAARCGFAVPCVWLVCPIPSWQGFDGLANDDMSAVPGAGDAGRAAKLAYCAQYLAAVQLLAVAAAGSGPAHARLYRYAAALPLDARHRLALTRESVARNRALGNYK